MSALDDIRDEVRRANARGDLAGFALGFPRLDRAAWDYGKARLEGLGLPSGQAGASREAGPEVYLATELYRDGGHTALVGDFVRARAARGRRAHLIVTNAAREARPLSPDIRARTGLAAADITELLDGSLEDRFVALANKLSELGPSRTFLFHHPEDSLAVAAAHPALCGRCFLVHHSDATPSLGLDIPGVTLIELNPASAALARVLRPGATLLLLTCPDPGPRPTAFLKAGRMVTASSGTQWKFLGETPCTYAEAVSVILRTTGGLHVHIGALEEAVLAAIRTRLGDEGVDPNAFLYRDWVPSVARALWEVDCDVFLASFPIDGARTLIEVAASGTPYLGHAARRRAAGDAYALGLPGAASWTGLDDLPAVLTSLSDPEVLAARSRSARDWYLRLHHPEVFAATIDSIVSGRGGVEDPDGAQREFAALSALTRRLAENALVESRVSPEAFAAIEARLVAAPALPDTAEAENVTEQAPVAPDAAEPVLGDAAAPAWRRAWRRLPVGLRHRLRTLLGHS